MGRIALFFCLFLAFVIAAIPFAVYKLALERGLSSSWLEIPKVSSGLLTPVPYRPTLEPVLGWESFHLGHFEVELPTSDVTYRPFPRLTHPMGVDFYTNASQGRGGRMAGLSIGRDFAWTTPTGGGKLFTLPLFKKLIAQKTNKVIWRDIVSRDLRPHKLLRLGIKGMLYQLFLLRTRLEWFGPDVQRIAYHPKTFHGLVQGQGEENFLQEVIYLSVGRRVYTMELQTLAEDLSAALVRDRIFQSASFRASDLQHFIPLYARWRRLSYREKITSRGTLLLYSAWTHDPRKKELFALMANYLKRGRFDRRELLGLAKHLPDRKSSSVQEKPREKTAERIKRYLDKAKRAKKGDEGALISW